MMRTLGLSIALVLLAGVAPASAGAFKYVDRAAYTGAAQTDGQRFLSYERENGHARVVDTFKGKSFDFAPPSFCTDPPRLEGVTSGRLLWTCSNRGRPIVETLRTRTFADLLGNVQLDEDGQPTSTWLGIGRYWVIGFDPTSDADFDDSFLNWRTNRSEIEPHSATKLADPDRKELFVRLCRPLSRPPSQQDGGPTESLPSFADYEYKAPFGLRESSDAATVTSLLLDRCGQHAPLVLTRRCHACVRDLTRRHAVWTEGNTVWAYVLRSRRRVRIGTVPFKPKRLGYFGVSETRDRLYVSELYPVRRPRIYAAALPGR
jgi:hypothetical protein